MLTEAYGADAMKSWLFLSGIKSLKRVRKMWKTTKELDIRKLTGQMKIVHCKFLEQGRTGEPVLLFGNIGKVTWGCSLEKTWTLAWCLDLASWQCPCSWCARYPGVFGQKTDNEIGPSTIFARFGPVWLLAVPKTEDHFSDIADIQGHATTILKRSSRVFLSSGNTDSLSILVRK
jgi:hypothetical protein